MYSLIKEIQIRGSALDIKEVGRYFYILDNTYNLYYLDKSTFEIKKNMSISSTFEPLHKFSHANAISSTGLINIAVAKKSSTIVLSTLNGLKKEKGLDYHRKDIECSAFSNNGKFLATGGEDGKVFIFNTEYMKMIIGLPNRADYISSLRFSDDDRYLIINCYDRSSFIYNLETAKFDNMVTGLPNVVERAQFFDNNTKVHYICRNGRSVIYDMKKDMILSNTKLFEEWPTTSVLTQDKKYVIVGTRGNALYAVDLSNNELVFKLNMHAIGITSFVLTNEYLVIGFSDGKVFVVDYKAGLGELEIHLKNRDYVKAKAMFDTNNFLNLHKYRDDFYAAWPEVLKIAIKMISKRKIVEAVEFVEPFTSDAKRAEEFEFYTTQIDDISALEELIKEKKYIQAMILADDKPFLKKLASYTTLEHFWNLVYDRVRAMVIEDAEYNKQKINDLLKQFLNVPSKQELASSLIKNYEKILEANEAAKEKRVADFYKIAEKFDFIKDTDAYNRIGSIGQMVYSQVMTFEQTGQYEKALEYLERLKEYAPFRDQAKQISNEIKGKLQFSEAVKSGDFKKAYSLINRYPNVRYLDEYNTLIEDFDKKIELATKESIKGNAKAALELLSEYLSNAYTVDKAATVIKLAYLHEIENGVTIQHSVNWAKTIDLFINLFGVDSELEYSCRKTPMAFDEYIASTNEGSIEGYKRLTLPETIIQFL